MQEPRDRGPAIARALLTTELRRLRNSTGHRQQDIARACEWSSAKIIRIESGATPVTKTDLLALLACYGVTGAERVRELTDLARTARQKGWWEDFPAAPVTRACLARLGYEHGADVIRTCDPLQVPGLLQTPAYTAAVLEAARIPSDAARAMAGLSRERQRQAAAQAPRQEYLIDETVLTRPAGDPGLMPAQLRRIADTARQPGITVRVIPRGAGLHYGLRGSFALLDLGASLGTILYAGNALHGDSLVTGPEPGEHGLPDAPADPGAVAGHAAGYFFLEDHCALSPVESLQLIEELARPHRWRQTAVIPAPTRTPRALALE